MANQCNETNTVFNMCLAGGPGAPDATGSVRCWYPWGGDCLWNLKEASGLWDPADVEKGSKLETLCLAVSPSGERAATGCSNSTVHLYDLRTHQSILTCKAR